MNPEKSLLERVAGSVLEDAAFVFAMPLEDAPPELASWQAVGARLTFQGPFNGYCELWAPFEMTKLLSANMLGTEEDAPDAQEMCFDAIKEALNILCGNLLTEMAGTDPVFTLRPPVILKALEPLPDDTASAEVWLESDGMPVLVRMRTGVTATEAA